MAKNIIIRRNKNGDIYSVESPLRYAEKYPEEEVLQKIVETNANLSEYASRYEVIRVSDLAGQIIEFLLGGGKYKRQHEISDIYLSFEQIIGTAQRLRNELNEMIDEMYDISDNLANVNKKIASLT